MSCECALNFDQWERFSKNYKPMWVWLWLVYKFTEKLLSLMIFLRVCSNSKEVYYLSWQTTYPNLKTACHIKLKRFLWTLLLESLLLAKYLISITAPLTNLSKEFFKKNINSIIKREKRYIFHLRFTEKNTDHSMLYNSDIGL